MSKLRWLALGYILALCINSCDSVLGDSGDSSSTFDLEYGDYGTVSWNPLYVRIVD